MNVSHGFLKAPKQSSAQSDSDTRLQGRTLLIARLVWSILVALALGVLFSTLPAYSAFFTQMQTPCSGGCGNGQLTLDALRTLHSFNISSFDYAVIVLATFALGPALVWIVTGSFLAWRKSDDWMALLVALFLILWGINFATIFGAIEANNSVLVLAHQFLSFFSFALLFPFLCLFPNGRLAPHWTLWFIFFGIAFVVFNSFPELLPSVASITAGPMFVVVVGGLLGVLVYRYLRVFTPIQKQQAKWLIYGLAVEFILADLGTGILSVFFPVLNQAGSLPNMISGIFWAMLFLCIPLSLAIAMLRYRLWDIDILINRTLVYGTLTVILTLIYVGGVFGLQFLLRGLTSGSDFSIIGSTLAIAALFQPLRSALQRLIDRRFYRRKYNAARTLAAFSTSLRGEIDLTQLSEHLVSVVNETMQPTSVSLWLRSPIKQEKTSDSL